MYMKTVFFGFLKIFKNFEICRTSNRFIGIQRPVFDQFFEHQLALGLEFVGKQLNFTINADVLPI